MARTVAGDFEILAVSDLAFREMTTEVRWRGETVAQLTMENGIECVEIELFTAFVGEGFVPRFPLDQFLRAVGVARDLLAEYSATDRAGGEELG